ncbi:MAG: TonB family protein [Bacteroidales bacterium]|nr:TonB family protein [Bacteroidales bacterium]
MGAFLSYMLQVSVIMTLLYLGYKWLMAGSTFHSLNRFALLSILAVSWLLPLGLPLFRVTHSVDIELGNPMKFIVVEEYAPAAPTFTLLHALLLLYFAGVVATFAFTCVGVMRVYRLISSGECVKEEGYILVKNPKAPGPMSWGCYVIVRPEDCDSDFEMVLRHERAHLSLLHWVDLVLTQLNIIFQWYSPTAWLLMHEVKCVHEYQADARVACRNATAYQLMLLKKTVGSSFPTFTDSLNHSQIKTRITMMLRKDSVSARRLAVLALPAMAALGVFTLSLPAVAGSIEAVKQVSMPNFSAGKITNSPAHVQEDWVVEEASESTVLPVPSASEADSPADAVVQEAIPASETNGQVESNAAQETSAAPVYFVDGILFTGNINYLKPSEIRSMSVVKNDPAYPQGKIMIVTEKGGERADATAEKIAEFKGGMSALKEYLAKTVTYSPEKLTKPVRVVVQFTIATDGSVSDAKIMRGAPADLGELNDEALRAVAATSGKWEPAQSDGHAVATRFTVPVTFTPKTAK